jgi:hypothetical protein
MQEGRISISRAGKGRKSRAKGVYIIFAGGSMQRIEIRWNNMLPSRWLLPFHVPGAVGLITYSRVGLKSHAKRNAPMHE